MGQTTRGRIYSRWSKIKARCNNPKAVNYERYGGKGISMCDEWLEFENFYQWALESGFDPNLTIDRIDNGKGYSPDNCRWVDYYTQENNRSDNVFLEHNGEKHTIAEWSRLLNISRKNIEKRLALGWSVEETLSTPVRRCNEPLDYDGDKYIHKHGNGYRAEISINGKTVKSKTFGTIEEARHERNVLYEKRNMQKRA